MGSTELEDLTPDTRRVADRLMELAAARGINVRVASTLRTCEEQNAIYAQGRTAPGPIISGASGCRSWHVWGRAIDVLILDPSKPNGVVLDGSDHRYDELGDIAKSLGMLWGGNFSWGRDAGHFEYHPGMTIGDLCPDSSPGKCNEQIQKHNSMYNPPVDPTIDPVSIHERGDELNFGHILISAFVGAVVLQSVKAIIYYANRKR